MFDTKKISHAMESHELSSFLLGEGWYQCVGGDFDGLNDFFSCWKTEILPYANAGQEERISGLTTNLIASFLDLLNLRRDRNMGLYAVILHCQAYYYYVYKQDIELVPFRLNLTNVAEKARTVFSELRESLILDTRWSGVQWNSQEGLWTPLNRVAAGIRNHENLDFV